MKTRFLFLGPLLIGITITIVIACVKDPEVTDGTIIIEPPTGSFIEEFDTVGNLESRGWLLVNNSEPIGRTGWKQGKYELGGKYGGDVVGFQAYSANNAPTDFAAADITAASDPGGLPATISAWMITPSIVVKNGDEISFYTRCASTTPDRLQVRANYTDETTDVGNTAESVGKFSNLLLDINPGLTSSAYPKTWTKYTITVAGLTAAVQKARFAFRYYVTNGGNSGANSDMIGIDRFSFTSK
jgi:hypothetical protein